MGLSSKEEISVINNLNNGEYHGTYILVDNLVDWSTRIICLE